MMPLAGVRLGSILIAVRNPCVVISGMLLKLPFVAIVAVMFIVEEVPNGILCIRKMDTAFTDEAVDANMNDSLNEAEIIEK